MPTNRTDINPRRTTVSWTYEYQLNGRNRYQVHFIPLSCIGASNVHAQRNLRHPTRYTHSCYTRIHIQANENIDTHAHTLPCRMLQFDCVAEWGRWLSLSVRIESFQAKCMCCSIARMNQPLHAQPTSWHKQYKTARRTWKYYIWTGYGK